MKYLTFVINHRNLSICIIMYDGLGYGVLDDSSLVLDPILVP
jgi:hypothetical protein